MPLYEYKCPACGAEKEKIAKMTDEVTCECGETMKRNVFTTFGGYSIKGDNSASTRPKGAGSK